MAGTEGGVPSDGQAPCSSIHRLPAKLWEGWESRGKGGVREGRGKLDEREEGRGAGRREHEVEGKGEDWRAGEEGSGHMSLMGDAKAHPSSALLQDSVSPSVKWLVKGPIRLREPVQGQRREESQEPRCHIFSQLPLLSSCLPDSGQGRGKGSQGWGPPRARATRALRRPQPGGS